MFLTFFDFVWLFDAIFGMFGTYLCHVLFVHVFSMVSMSPDRRSREDLCEIDRGRCRVSEMQLNSSEIQQLSSPRHLSNIPNTGYQNISVKTLVA